MRTAIEHHRDQRPRRDTHGSSPAVARTTTHIGPAGLSGTHRTRGLPAACAPKAHYEPPAPVQPPAFTENANWKPAQPRDADARGAWWEIFGDPALALELAQNRFRGGLASAADVAQAETQLETTRVQAVDIRAERTALEHAIAILVGELPAGFTLPPSPIDAEPPDVPIGLPSELLERRADIAAAERRLASSFADVAVAQSAFYPLLTLSASAGFESTSFGSWLATASHFWTAGPAALINVLDFGRRRAAADEARAAYTAAAATYQEAVLTAFREVEDELAALRVLEEEADIQDRAIAASERSLALANNRYRGGGASYLEVITAQGFALSNERAGVNLLARRMTATVRLLKALGGDWRSSQAITADPSTARRSSESARTSTPGSR